MENFCIRGISQPKEVFQIFVQELETYLREIVLPENHLQIREFSDITSFEPDNSQLVKTLHRLRGSAGFLGFAEILNLTISCEKALKNKSGDLYLLLEELKTNLSDLYLEINKQING
ncbi:MAG TPA: Hpt domain-containing protein [Oligoflexia bacterium]|nr:Hpt domain-containing protein [Oligoflexia bacterium]HMP47134.1 Hpt domain-containing protein [Oligoflexia bacterium]